MLPISSHLRGRLGKAFFPCKGRLLSAKSLLRNSSVLESSQGLLNLPNTKIAAYCTTNDGTTISDIWHVERYEIESKVKKRSGEHTLLQVWLLSITEQCTLRIGCEVDEEWTTGLSFTTHLYSSQVFNRNVCELDGGCALKCGLYKTTQTTLTCLLSMIRNCTCTRMHVF